MPLYRSISRETVSTPTKEAPPDRRESTNEDRVVKETKTKERDLTWYVSKKVTYLGADTGAMMRVEMTEGSLDWTLFYNEKNLLTQISEHYLLNGLGNFRSGQGLF